MKVNIDLYIDGEIEEIIEVPKQSVEIIEPLIIPEKEQEERMDLLEEMLEEKKEKDMEEELTINNQNINTNNNEQ